MSNLFLKLPEVGRKMVVGFLNGNEVARLDTAMVNGEGRAALYEAYKDTEVYGAVFYCRDENHIELCHGLEWMKRRGMISRDFCFQCSRPKADHFYMFISSRKVNILEMIITHCFDPVKSYDINSPTGTAFSDRRTPLTCAVAFGELEVTRMLCEREDLRINMCHDNDWPALHDAANNANFELMDVLLDVGKADINARDGDRLTPLHASLMCLSHGKDNLDVVKYLVERGGEVNLLDSEGRSPLDYAEEGDEMIGVVTYLLSKGALRGEVFTA